MDKTTNAAARKAAFWKLYAAQQEVRALNRKRGPLGHGVIAWTDEKRAKRHEALRVAPEEMSALAEVAQ